MTVIACSIDLQGALIASYRRAAQVLLGRVADGSVTALLEADIRYLTSIDYFMSLKDLRPKQSDTKFSLVDSRLTNLCIEEQLGLLDSWAVSNESGEMIGYKGAAILRIFLMDWDISIGLIDAARKEQEAFIFAVGDRALALESVGYRGFENLIRKLEDGSEMASTNSFF